PNGVDLARFRPDAEVPPEAGRLRPYVLFVGRLEQRKGLEVLLRAMPAVCSRHPAVRLVVVGSGPLERQCHRLCAELGIADRVRFVGRVEGDRLPGWYAGAELYVSPALGGEAMGIVLIEAMAAGRPVIASRIPGYDEVIADRRDGILVEPGAGPALADAISGLLTDPARCRELTAAGLRTIERYAWPRVAGQVEQVYREVLD
ncbi:MAG TPA: glycosyltransferase family 1 protein, partial [candidate division WOR-3 bacterium]|nr:glycosyltransferase family 1 protein [candidate division WOR-3 bacterium]